MSTTPHRKLVAVTSTLKNLDMKVSITGRHTALLKLLILIRDTIKITNFLELLNDWDCSCNSTVGHYHYFHLYFRRWSRKITHLINGKAWIKIQTIWWRAQFLTLAPHCLVQDIQLSLLSWFWIQWRYAYP